MLTLVFVFFFSLMAHLSWTKFCLNYLWLFCFVALIGLFICKLAPYSFNYCNLKQVFISAKADAHFLPVLHPCPNGKSLLPPMWFSLWRRSRLHAQKLDEAMWLVLVVLVSTVVCVISRPAYLIVNLRLFRDLFYQPQCLAESEIDSTTSAWISV